MAKSIVFFVALLSFFSAVTRTTAGHKKTTHLHFFQHDTPVASKPTTVQVAGPPLSNASSTLFGQLYVLDDPITMTADPNSTLIGRVQGMYAFTSQSELSMSIYVNIIFTNKMYNGSQISFVGQDPLLRSVRELPIVGGTGAFRYASGYVEFRTVMFDQKTGNAILDVNVYVRHY